MHAERDFETLRAMIVERRARLPKRLAQVAVHALDNPDEIAFGTAASVAQAAIVQPSTLVRFAQAFGYRVLASCRKCFARGCATACRVTTSACSACASTAFRPKSSLVLDGFLEAAQRSVVELRERIDQDLLERAVDTLAGRRHNLPDRAYGVRSRSRRT